MSDLLRWGMESTSAREAAMRERVAEGSVLAQKMSDEYHRPERTLHFQIQELRTHSAPMRGAIHADLKHAEHGSLSTFTSAMYYNDVATKRRDELMAKLEAEKKEQEAAAAAEE